MVPKPKIEDEENEDFISDQDDSENNDELLADAFEEMEQELKQIDDAI